MSYAQYEVSRQDGVPTSLYLFEYGDSGNYYGYTDLDEDVSHGGKIYVAAPIGREKIESNGLVDKKTLQVKVAPTVPLVSDFLLSPPAGKMQLSIRQGHASDNFAETKLVWTGIVKNINREGVLATVIAEPMDTLLAQPGLRRHFMYGCPHVLYGPKCKANKLTLRKMVEVTRVEKNFIEIPAGWNGATSVNAYVGGYVEWTDGLGDKRVKTILRYGANTNTLILGGVILGLLPTDIVSIFAGCNHQVSDCDTVHGNIVNYGGQPYIPLENPVGYVNRYY